MQVGSLISKYLTGDVHQALKDRRTLYGGTLDLLTLSGTKNPDSSIGVYASDPEAYSLFSPLFDPIITSYHQLCPNFKQPPCFFGEPVAFCNLDPHRNFILSTRIRCARSIRGYPFNSLLKEDQYQEIEDRVSTILTGDTTGLQGVYRSLATIPEAEQKSLVQNHLLFKSHDRFLQGAKACRFWPNGRGIFYNNEKTVFIWVNEEDHLRIISMDESADLASIYTRLVKALGVFDTKMEFVRDQRLGFLTFCPSNIGTTIRASVHIRLPYLSGHKRRLARLAETLNLQIRGTHGEHSDVESGIYDISNTKRCGISEYEVLKEFEFGIKKILEAEIKGHLPTGSSVKTPEI